MTRNEIVSIMVYAVPCSSGRMQSMILKGGGGVKYARKVAGLNLPKREQNVMFKLLIIPVANIDVLAVDYASTFARKV